MNFLSSFLLAMLIAILGATQITSLEIESDLNIQYKVGIENVPTYKYFQDIFDDMARAQQRQRFVKFIKCIENNAECSDQDKIFKDYILYGMKNNWVESLTNAQFTYAQCIGYIIQGIENGKKNDHGKNYGITRKRVAPVFFEH